jgi:hypothetical protein
MNILSIDVGLKNLGVCNVDSDGNILYWNVLEVNNINELIKSLDSIFNTDINTVVIEKQPSFNPRMRSVASAIQTYFIIRGQVDHNSIHKILFYSPKYKLQICEDHSKLENAKKSQKYRIHKQMAIDQTRKMITDDHLTFFNKHKKKDDLADSYLQAISYLSSKDINTEIIARKPTETQLNNKKLKECHIIYLRNQALLKELNELESLLIVKKAEDNPEDKIRNYFNKKCPYILNKMSIESIMSL